MRPSRSMAALCGGLLFCFSAQGVAAEGPTYTLRYKFQPGETVRWKVIHKAKVATTVSGTSQTAETDSESVKLWRVVSVDPKTGAARFEHSVESVEMRQQLTGREEVRYNSLTDKEPPHGFEDAAKNVGVVLSVITLDPTGEVVSRENKQAQANPNEGQITVPLAKEPVRVGDTWTSPYELPLADKNGRVVQVKTRQRFKLDDVTGDIATISVETQILTPINDPGIEAQLVQRESNGKVRFDMVSGRVVGQQMDLDKKVHGFAGEASVLHYVMRFTEELLPSRSATATRPKAGPAPIPPQKPVAAKPPASAKPSNKKPPAPVRPPGKPQQQQQRRRPG
ncbi:MAG: hypothetical protein KF708_07545 [Pirellulales bacterium]|nr:hypothetical protein [Pirellulales bacterium]